MDRCSLSGSGFTSFSRDGEDVGQGCRHQSQRCPWQVWPISQCPPWRKIYSVMARPLNSRTFDLESCSRGCPLQMRSVMKSRHPESKDLDCDMQVWRKDSKMRRTSGRIHPKAPNETALATRRPTCAASPCRSATPTATFRRNGYHHANHSLDKWCSLVSACPGSARLEECIACTP